MKLVIRQIVNNDLAIRVRCRKCGHSVEMERSAVMGPTVGDMTLRQFQRAMSCSRERDDGTRCPGKAAVTIVIPDDGQP